MNVQVVSKESNVEQQNLANGSHIFDDPASGRLHVFSIRTHFSFAILAV